MARIRFNISAALSKWRRRDNTSLRRFTMMDLQGGDDLPRGPGWFDSSWDLGNGLAVEVAMPGDPGFQAWLEAQAHALLPALEGKKPAVADGALEFEAVDWKAWAMPQTPVSVLPEWQAPDSRLPELTLELQGQELALELTLA